VASSIVASTSTSDERSTPTMRTRNQVHVMASNHGRHSRNTRGFGN